MKIKIIGKKCQTVHYVRDRGYVCTDNKEYFIESYPQTLEDMVVHEFNSNFPLRIDEYVTIKEKKYRIESVNRILDADEETLECMINYVEIIETEETKASKERCKRDIENKKIQDKIDSLQRDISILKEKHKWFK